MSQDTIDTFDTLLLTPQYLADPYAVFSDLRSNDPVHWSERMNGWVVTRYDDVKIALQDTRLISGQRLRSYMGQFPEAIQKRMESLYNNYTKWLVMMDPPNHTRLRALVNKAFTPRMVEGLRPLIQKLNDELFDAFEAAGRMDAIKGLAYPLPASVISEMLGIPQKDRQQFNQWADEMTAFLGSGRPKVELAEAALKSVGELTRYFLSIVAERRANPKEDLISILVGVEEEGQKITEDEILAMCIFLLVAGHETTMALISNGLLALLRYPDQFDKLKKDPVLVESAVEEFLRYDSPLQHQIRIADEDFEMRGKAIKKGQRVVLMLGAANHDPEMFPNPDQLDICRSPNRHLAFGLGKHFCIGAPLARLEGHMVFADILRRFPTLKLENEDIEWRIDTSMRNPKEMWVTF